MPRPLRFVPDKSLVEITTRTFQGRILLKPSAELTDLLLGIIGKAQNLYGMTIHAFVFLSTHAHFLLSPTSAGQLALFMQFVNANVAKEAGRLHVWREGLWSRRYRSIVVADDKLHMLVFAIFWPMGRKRVSSGPLAPGQDPTALQPSPPAISCAAPGSTAAPNTSPASAAKPYFHRSLPQCSTSS
jgi:hypothetical protein